MNINDLQNNAIEYNAKKKQQARKLLLTIIPIVLVVCAIVAAILLIPKNETKEDTLYIGNWKCSNDVDFNVEENGFTMEYTTQDAIFTGTYELKEKKDKDDVTSFLIDFKATKRVINGTVSNSPVSTQYEINVVKDNKDAMVMINTATYSIYNCTRRK